MTDFYPVKNRCGAFFQRPRWAQNATLDVSLLRRGNALLTLDWDSMRFEWPLSANTNIEIFAKTEEPPTEAATLQRKARDCSRALNV